MKRILISAGTLVFIGAVALSATGAFFSDTETSTGNTFAAGEVDITIEDLTHTYNGDDPNNAPDFTEDGFSFDLTDLKPLDEGVITYDLLNSSNEVYMCAAVEETGNNENDRLEPETSAGDTTDGAGNGELGNFLSFIIGSSTAGTLASTSGEWFSLGVVAGDASTSTAIEYCFGEVVGGVCQLDPNAEYNQAQTDSLTADVHFYAVQTRNNPDFTCADLPPVGGEEPVDGPEVGALLSSYVAPTGDACNVTVASTTPALDTIGEGIAAATAGQTVCVEAGTYPEDVVVNKDITLAGAGSGSTNIIGQTSGEAGAVVITANGATVEGFNITDATGGIAALRISGVHSGISVLSNTLNAVTGGNAFLTDGGQSNHTISNNVFNGVAGQPIAYVNGLASVNVASDNVDFTQNSFLGSGSVALGQEASNSSVTLNKFSASTSFTDVEDWEGGNNYNQNNFNDAGLNLQHSENANTGDNGITDAENNWWGDTNASDGDVNPNVDVDFDPEAASAFPEN